jgi:hypothetical protein
MDEQYGTLIEPPPVPFHFGAPGWYVAGGLLLLLLIIAAWLLSRHYRKNLYRRQALQWLRSKEEELQHAGSLALLVYETNMLLKRIAIGRYGRTVIAASRDAQWIALLNKTMKKNLFDNKDEQLLQQQLYRSKGAILPDEAAAFIARSKKWIQQHRYTYAF